MAGAPLLSFVQEARVAGRVTNSWTVVCRGAHLGRVAWYAQWRRYCFWPARGALFDADCLDRIAHFCRQRTVARQQERKLTSVLPNRTKGGL